MRGESHGGSRTDLGFVLGRLSGRGARCPDTTRDLMWRRIRYVLARWFTQALRRLGQYSVQWREPAIESALVLDIKSDAILFWCWTMPFPWCLVQRPGLPTSSTFPFIVMPQMGAIGLILPALARNLSQPDIGALAVASTLLLFLAALQPASHLPSAARFCKSLNIWHRSARCCLKRRAASFSAIGRTKLRITWA